MRITADVSELSELKKVLARWFDEAPDELGAFLYKEAKKIMGESKKHYVPVDLGNLKNSGHVSPPENDGAGIVVIVGFGGPAASYALEVHEDLQTHHEVGRAKYLEIPFLERVQDLPQRLAERAEETIDD
jgi:hypothetical protein